MIDPTSKECRICEVTLPIALFHVRRSSKNGKWYARGECRPCAAAGKRLFRAQHPEHHRNKYRMDPSVFGNYRLKHKYGITLAQKHEMLESQGRSCSICQRPLDGSSKDLSPHVEHNHITGDVRSITCHSCNCMIGFARENIGVLRAGIAYLEAHSAARRS